ncbi:structural protein P5 [Stenotrophomonas sp. NLF4-10]|uniref:structural protein P5 n=1 Tax=Stenotrophomonas sp. NLF4-10 TaxID=2918754 RepID=UPI001EFA6BC0|nr:structural protein P5 [Stenotrophomonas sp. NLF4-10]MCG8275390.1 structural protein P5 [Stenotrophomonas sp. NLF4-10]
MDNKPTPRGVRNNNPGNIDRTAVVWQGEDRSPEALKWEHRFCVFLTPQAGFRALAKTLLTYQVKHGLRTVKEIINRWAPPVENNTSAYVAQVAREVGVGTAEIIRLDRQVTLQRLVTAIARHENGGLFWPGAVIEAGVREALS